MRERKKWEEYAILLKPGATTVMTEAVRLNEGKEFAVFIWGLKHSWGRGVYSSCCTVNKRSIVAWLGLGVCKVRGNGQGGYTYRGRCSEIHLLFKCTKIWQWRDKLLNNKWRNVNEDMAVTELLTGNKITELRNLGAFAYRIKCKKTRAKVGRGIRTCL